MENNSNSMTHATHSATLADVLERILDKGVVIAGDIKIKLVDIELLTIQIRLLICSVDKAKEMGIDWWMTNSYLSSAANEQVENQELDVLRARIAHLEQDLARQPAAPS
ncbi:gas vesicle protein [Rhodoferax antarcticus]|uniref:gas vesicle protein n=1 Tax=Rhodoferax antarcticus TaxID=81479 RepID=UPI0022250FA9|nr:gas vesicle protein [Rhodoferax antarcticus]MCW2313325.1 argonaute-like protein implicated in RNA metabolism and viral defense [Rhodoferax antarcticus]